MTIENMDSCDWMYNDTWYKFEGNKVILTELAPPHAVESFKKWKKLHGYE